MFTRSIAALLLAAVATPAAAATVVLDFDAARGTNGRTGYVYGPWIEDGFQVSANRCSTSNTCFVTTGTTLSSLDRTGAALTNFQGNAVTTIARVGGGAFALDSLDIANNYGNFSGYGPATMDVDFTFNFADGSSLARTYVLANTAGQRLTVNSLTFDLAPLSSFSFTPRAGSSGFAQFDNIRLSDVAAAAVPEPATWAMMIGGFGLVGGAMRRRRTLVAA
ncbi:hypothetical protein GGR88_002728 [Sphingomonas jejuensis]|uniref:Ice-binding protein C-terminal domain-containing protein n=1 Tax=Sphingomonas jejuensis TaxID=904715 RepID=A0ABX0XR09_9SPHN|nr:PEPxxWA-CTERM sorting domain-containing protein [Sphingomonas jejuensis]NJC35214.1 hypothetical protein [Sphingomonas jejuensis]